MFPMAEIHGIFFAYVKGLTSSNRLNHPVERVVVAHHYARNETLPWVLSTIAPNTLRLYCTMCPDFAHTD